MSSIEYLKELNLGVVYSIAEEQKLPEPSPTVLLAGRIAQRAIYREYAAIAANRGVHP